MFSRVLLPQPDGPMMDTTSPRRMARSSPCTARSPRFTAARKMLGDAAEFDFETAIRRSGYR